MSHRAIPVQFIYVEDMTILSLVERESVVLSSRGNGLQQATIEQTAGSIAMSPRQTLGNIFSELQEGREGRVKPAPQHFVRPGEMTVVEPDENLPEPFNIHFRTETDDSSQGIALNAGFGARMLARTGHKDGQGLSKYQDGRSNDIEVVMGQVNLGLGALPEKKQPLGTRQNEAMDAIKSTQWKRNEEELKKYKPCTEGTRFLQLVKNAGEEREWSSFLSSDAFEEESVTKYTKLELHLGEDWVDVQATLDAG